MGYDVEQGRTSFTVLPEHQDMARRAAQALLSPDDISLAEDGCTECGSDRRRGEWFAFMNLGMEPFANATTLAEVLTAWRWMPTTAADGSITGLTFRGSRSDDTRYLFVAIGPYVQPGSFVEMHGEDGAHWRWRFTGEACLLDILTPSEWGPSWLRPLDVPSEPAPEPAEREPWETDPDGWRR